MRAKPPLDDEGRLNLMYRLQNDVRARTKAQRMTKSIEETCTSLDDPKSSAYSAAARSKVREGGVNGMGQGPIRSTRGPALGQFSPMPRRPLMRTSVSRTRETP